MKPTTAASRVRAFLRLHPRARFVRVTRAEAEAIADALPPRRARSDWQESGLGVPWGDFIADLRVSAAMTHHGPHGGSDSPVWLRLADLERLLDAAERVPDG